ncbi:MAG: hypothetical protein HOP04_11095 [Methylophilaceae bacterium]|nr:hypothetical protein [Methylophilaceae bacterium]
MFKKYLLKVGGLILLGMLLTGCDHEVALLTPEGVAAGSGRLSFTDSNTAHASFVIAGKNYQGTWVAQKVDESRAIAAHYGFASRKYQSYATGNGSYLKKGEAILLSEQGETLKCEISVRAAAGRARCVSAAETFDLVIKG